MSDENEDLNAKLIAAKEKWAKEGRGLSGDAPTSHNSRLPEKPRLPAGQHLTQGLPVLDLGIQPNLSTADWTLTVAGAVDRPFTWDWRTFLDQPQVELTTDIHCVTTWSSYDNVWKGVPVRHLIEAARVRPKAAFVMLRSYDGYTTNIPMEHFAAADVLIAHSWQNEPLSREHGGPARLVVPKLYFWKSAKWVRAITFMEKDAPGYWELRGYHTVGDPWKEERYW